MAGVVPSPYGAGKNALQPSHRGWIKPGLASGRSSDSRFAEEERLPEIALSGWTFRPSPSSLRLQLRGSGGIRACLLCTALPDTRFLTYNGIAS